MKRIISLILVTCALLLCFTGCSLINSEQKNNDDSDSPDNNTFIGDEDIGDLGEECGMPPFLDDYFSPNNGSAFMKLKLDGVYEGLYSDDENDEIRYAIAKCTVVEDYYGVIESNTEITVKFYLNYERNFINEEYIFESELEEIISDFDYLFIHFKPYGENLLYDKKELYSWDAAKNVEFENLLIRNASLTTSRFIPVKDGRVNFDRLHSLCSDYDIKLHESNVVKYDKYFYQGMTEDKLIENIKSLFEGKIID